MPAAARQRGSRFQLAQPDGWRARRRRQWARRDLRVDGRRDHRHTRRGRLEQWPDCLLELRLRASVRPALQRRLGRTQRAFEAEDESRERREPEAGSAHVHVADAEPEGRLRGPHAPRQRVEVTVDARAETPGRIDRQRERRLDVCVPGRRHVGVVDGEVGVRPAIKPAWNVGTRQARYPVDASSRRGQMMRDRRDAAGPVSAAFTASALVASAPTTCACAHETIWSRFGSSSTGTAGSVNCSSDSAYARGTRAIPGCSRTTTRQSQGLSTAPAGAAGVNDQGTSGVANSTQGSSSVRTSRCPPGARCG